MNEIKQDDAKCAPVERGIRLLPCPFCGSNKSFGQPYVKSNKAKTGISGRHYAIRCGVCTFDGPRGYTETEAIKNWNKRA